MNTYSVNIGVVRLFEQSSLFLNFNNKIALIMQLSKSSQILLIGRKKCSL